MDVFTVLNSAVGLMSLVLGGFAIWLSFQFYSKAKDAEKGTAVTLEAIKAQSEALQKLTGRWMDRFTRHATEPKPADEGLLALVNAMANLPTTILTHLRVYPESRGGEVQEAALSHILNGYICLYHYTALANVGWQTLLPASGEVDEMDASQVLMAQIVNSTFEDFRYIESVLGKVEKSRLEASAYADLLGYTVRILRPRVADTATVLAVRQGTKPNEDVTTGDLGDTLSK
ncbi:MAG: hypothetical protein AB1473_03360 [Thermodesulfobacteriota bacterium]